VWAAALCVGGYQVPADFERRDLGPECFDDAGGLETGCKGAGRFELIFVFDDQRIGIIDAAGLDDDTNFFGARNGLGNLSKDEAIRSACMVAHQGFHQRHGFSPWTCQARSSPIPVLESSISPLKTR
jgi:hypothetical protein